MKVTCSLQKVADAFNSIRNIEKDKASSKFSYAIAKNMTYMQADINGLEAVESNIVNADRERVKYCEENAKKGEDGKTLMENGHFVGIDETKPEFIAIVDNVNKLRVEHSDFLKTEVTIDFHMIDFKDVPESISPVNMRNLLIMINEPELDKKNAS